MDLPARADGRRDRLLPWRSGCVHPLGSFPVHSVVSSLQTGLYPLVLEMVRVHSHVRMSVLRARTP